MTSSTKYRPLILIVTAFCIAAGILTFFYLRNQSFNSTTNLISSNKTATTSNHTPTHQSGTEENLVPKQTVTFGTHTAAIEHGSRTRNYEVHIPTNYQPNTPSPLVLLLHGGGGTGKRILSQTKMDSKADASNFIVVAPQGVEKHWNDGLPNTGKLTDKNNIVATIDDVAFIKTLLDTLQNDYAIDPKRIYVTGISNGGQMTQRLACELPGVFAAIAPVASPMREGDSLCGNPEPIPLVAIHGTEDPFFPIYDDDGLPKMPRLLASRGAEQTALTTKQLTKFWTTVNQCTGEPNVETWPDTANDGTTVEVLSFTDCLGSLAIKYYIVHGAGHGWPPGGDSGDLATRITGDSSENLITNDVIWDFFLEHTR